MISEQDKQEILDGAYGITRNGIKCKYVGTNTSQRYVFAFFNDKDEVLHVIDMLGKFNRFKHDEDCRFDVVGLWKDKPEPFYLNRALAGEPICYGNDSRKYWVIGRTRENQYIENNVYVLQRDVTNTAQQLIYLFDLDDLTKNSVMWKEPEPVSNTVTVTLPRALKEPKDEMWFINLDGEVSKSNYKKNSISKESFERRIYFGSEADAQAWLDAMKNNCR